VESGAAAVLLASLFCALMEATKESTKAQRRMDFMSGGYFVNPPAQGQSRLPKFTSKPKEHHESLDHHHHPDVGQRRPEIVRRGNALASPPECRRPELRRFKPSHRLPPWGGSRHPSGNQNHQHGTMAG
jgi:hypothetical protein